MFFQSLDDTREAFEEAMTKRYKVQLRAFARITTAEGKEHYAHAFVNNWWFGWREALNYVEESRKENQR